MSGLRGADGVIDLASIMVGVVVTAVIGAVLGVGLLGVIPWTQDSAAIQSLNDVRLAQSTAKMNSGSYVDYDQLVSSGLTTLDANLDAVTGLAGKCFIAGSRSASGTVFYTTNQSSAILNNKSGSPDTTWCNSSEFMFTRATNTSTNPSFETAGSQAETRRNLILNPGGTTAGSWNGRWFGGGAPAGTYTTVAAGGPVSGPTSFMRKTWTAAPTANGNTGFQIFGNVGPGSRAYAVPTTNPVTTVTFSGWLRSSAAGKTSVGAKLYWYDAANAPLSPTATAGPQTTLVAGVWTKISITAAVPATAAFAAPILDVDSGTVWAVGDTLDGTGALFERGSKVGSYFDGLTTTLNIAVDPRAQTNAAFFSNNSAMTTVTRQVPVTGNPAGIVTAAKSVPGATASSNILSLYNVDGLQATGPARYLGVWVYVSAPGYRARWSPDAFVAIPASTWVFLTSQGEHPDVTHTTLQITTANGSNTGASDYAYATGVVAQAGAPVAGFYDAADQDFTYAGSAAAGASASVERAARVATASEGGSSSILSKEWSSSGASSMRVRTLYAGPYSAYVGVGGDTAGMRLGMTPGNTYTAVVDVKMLRARGVPTPRMAAYSRIGAGTYAYNWSNAPADAAGQTELRVTFTVPTGSTEAFVRVLNMGPQGSDDVWFDDFMLTEGTYTGPYFDGNSPNWAWAGTPNASVSSGYTVAP